MTQAYNLSQFANFLNSSGQVSAAGIQSGVVVSSGTVMLFYQSAAPTGWTQVTSLNDYALRLVSGAGGGTGGTTAFSTVFTNQTPTISNTLSVGSISIGATTLSSSQIPAHSHTTTANNNPWGTSSCSFVSSGISTNQLLANIYGYNTGDAGGGGSHSHSVSGGSITGGITSSAITLNVRYANIIICSKN